MRLSPIQCSPFAQALRGNGAQAKVADKNRQVPIYDLDSRIAVAESMRTLLKLSQHTVEDRQLLDGTLDLIKTVQNQYSPKDLDEQLAKLREAMSEVKEMRRSFRQLAQPRNTILGDRDDTAIEREVMEQALEAYSDGDSGSSVEENEPVKTKAAPKKKKTLLPARV